MASVVTNCLNQWHFHQSFLFEFGAFCDDLIDINVWWTKVLPCWENELLFCVKTSALNWPTASQYKDQRFACFMSFFNENHQARGFGLFLFHDADAVLRSSLNSPAAFASRFYQPARDSRQSDTSKQSWFPAKGRVVVKETDGYTNWVSANSAKYENNVTPNTWKMILVYLLRVNQSHVFFFKIKNRVIAK